MSDPLDTRLLYLTAYTKGLRDGLKILDSVHVALDDICGIESKEQRKQKWHEFVGRMQSYQQKAKSEVEQGAKHDAESVHP